MARSSKPNVLIIALDCVRADHLGCYGYRGTETPAMDRIAAEGALFEQAVCPCPNTWVSFASLFTGCNPYRHGVRTKFAAIRRDLPTVAEVLKGGGYRTAGFPGFGFLTRERGFGRGTDDYFLPEEAAPKGQNGIPRFQKPERQVELLLAWLDRGDERPFFAWLHYVPTHLWPHGLLDLPGEYRKRYSDAWQYYDGKIAYADDTFVRPIFEGLAERGVLDDTILVVTADHGEILWHHLKKTSEGGHGDIPLDPAIHVPLILRAPSLVPAGLRVSDQVRSIDLMPTLLDLAGERGLREGLEGRSLAPLLDGEAGPAGPRGAYIENLDRGLERAYVGIRTERWKLLLVPPPGAVTATPRVARGTLRRIYRSAVQVPVLGGVLGRLRRGIEAMGSPPDAAQAGDEPDPVALGQEILDAGHPYALYDLQADPHEVRDVAMDHPEVVRELLGRLRGLVSRGEVAEVREIEDEDREAVEKQLRDLGYM